MNNESFIELYKGDMRRYNNSPEKYEKDFLYHFRKCQTVKNVLLRLYHRYKYKKLRESRGVEIPYTAKIGKGLYLGHTYSININENAIIGENINIHKGVTIGQENRGKRKGAPRIGNMVWIGVNAVVVGNIVVGDDVLIAPNSYVNCDVPSHSIVIGNPCKIIPREDATKDYIVNTV